MLTLNAVFLCFLLTYCVAQVTDDPDKLLSWCLDAKHHKEKPGPESELYSQCTPWKDRSCCTYNTTKNLHESGLDFNYNHCSSIRNMSEGCKRHFIQEHCFFQCSPNMGPWVVKVNMKNRKERFYHVPLCESDCETWFLACQDDYTCTDNWVRNFIWEKNVGNKCVPGAECLTFRQIYKTAANFCQKVWDDAWMVVSDSEACMRMWFDGTAGNPNENVVRYKVQQMSVVSGSSAVMSSAILLIIFLVLLRPLSDL